MEKQEPNHQTTTEHSAAGPKCSSNSSAKIPWNLQQVLGQALRWHGQCTLRQAATQVAPTHDQTSDP
eukprot:8963913-Heterocapsa_arctica.AAC.1